ncbi:MAG: ATP synthase F1 subunit epsilon [Candidatus Magasanikbacteria bacterium RIFOXYD2_FULL_39_9]|uniref:ATP synthase epsilon chain n=1 Tax=Candidatus Magasanikbacteria bacterium RIFOXYD1_FULL_40_23 TaxID=1798705 RepID=A0A1F6PBG1_9BACT|nr:MAG: ATP synthase F1 subunit epsilon [Candidatus Magasanikbacteria bacterium RIFOXYD2_FULL_39_9]OGH93294.1 MAG: ATP synthase F1 subunit epsilon [Candidatus Magasanikbacteria bacterium RIFOXYD1_FULL_40_23]
MSTLKFKIVTPEKTIYENEIFQATIPTMEGEITVLPNHIPLISVLKAGELKFKDKEGEQQMAVSGGFLEVRGKNEIVILADHAQRVAEIDVDKAEEARARAEEQMANLKNAQDVDYAKLQAIMDRELNKLRVAKKYKNLPISK